MSKYLSLRKRINTFRALSAIISIMMHPLIMATVLFSIVSFNAPQVLGNLTIEGRMWLIELMFVTTYLLPLIIFILVIIILEKKFSLSRLYMENKEQRVLPFLYTGIFYAGITYLLYTELHMSLLLVMMMASISLCIILVSVISIFWKISAHATAVSGVIIFLVITQYLFTESTMLWPLIILIFLGGLLLSARLYLEAHTLEQIFAGVMLAVLVCGSSLIFLL